LIITSFASDHHSILFLLVCLIISCVDFCQNEQRLIKQCQNPRMVQFDAKIDPVPLNASYFVYNLLTLIQTASLCWLHNVLHFLHCNHCPTMCQSNNVNDAFDNVIIVVMNGQKRRSILYDIRTIYFCLHCLLCIREATSCSSIAQPACMPQC